MVDCWRNISITLIGPVLSVNGPGAPRLAVFETRDCCAVELIVSPPVILVVVQFENCRPSAAKQIAKKLVPRRSRPSAAIKPH
jgi:hypothetical protein